MGTCVVKCGEGRGDGADMLKKYGKCKGDLGLEGVLEIQCLSLRFHIESRCLSLALCLEVQGLNIVLGDAATLGFARKSNASVKKDWLVLCMRVRSAVLPLPGKTQGSAG